MIGRKTFSERVINDLLIECFGGDLINVKSEGIQRTKITVQKNFSEEVFATVFINEDEKNTVQIMSNFDRETLEDFFTILNEIPRFNCIDNSEIPQKITYTASKTTGARGTIRLSAYNIQKFIKKLIYKTIFAEINTKTTEDILIEAELMT